MIEYVAVLFGFNIDLFHFSAEYPGDTELHLVWDIDQSKRVGEGTNDVELVRLFCTLFCSCDLVSPSSLPSRAPPLLPTLFVPPVKIEEVALRH